MFVVVVGEKETFNVFKGYFDKSFYQEYTYSGILNSLKCKLIPVLPPHTVACIQNINDINLRGTNKPFAKRPKSDYWT